MTSKDPSCGPVERKVREDVAALLTAHPMGEALAEVAFFLARALDIGVLDPRIAKELRETLSELVSMREDDDDGLETRLSSPLRHDEDT